MNKLLGLGFRYMFYGIYFSSSLNTTQTPTSGYIKWTQQKVPDNVVCMHRDIDSNGQCVCF